MTTIDTPSRPALQAQLLAVTTMVRQQAPAAVIQTIEAANQKLLDDGLAQRALRVGQSVPDFSLPDATGRIVKFAELRASGPVVLTFYRGAWCPYCNLELQAWQQHLDELRSLGGTLVAISPQTPDHSLSLAEKHHLAYPVLSDAGNQVARQFGLVFKLDESLRPIYQAFGIDLIESNGDDSFELPVPATYLIGADGRVLSAWVNVDYRQRAEPSDVLAVARSATTPA